jgi:hypothetical protein
MQRQNWEAVLGCNDETARDHYTDYCYTPIPLDPNLPPIVTVGNNWVPDEAFPLKNCEGDCDRDSDCEVRDAQLII